MMPILLCTDMDRTLIPNGNQPESAGVRELFGSLAATELISLAYVTGRHRPLIEEAIGQYQLPTPDFAIADVGASIFQVNQQNWKRWHHWDNTIADDWQAYSREGMHQLLCEIPELRLQEPEKQGRFKLSYYVPMDVDHQQLIVRAETLLSQQYIRANLIWSVDEAKNIGLLDVLPVSANKLHAINFLMQQCGFDITHTLFAGDSGNDLDVLLSPLPSVLVANASDDVRQSIEQSNSELQSSIYQASGGFLGMNGNYSAGILEGLVHFHPELTSSIEALSHA